MENAKSNMKMNTNSKFLQLSFPILPENERTNEQQITDNCYVFDKRFGRDNDCVES